MLHEDHDDLKRQAPEHRRVCLQSKHIPKHTLLHPLKFLLETDVRCQAQEHHKLLLWLYLQDRLVDLHEEGSILVSNGVIKKEIGLQLKSVVFLVGKHDSTFVGDGLINDDSDHAFFGRNAFQHLFA